MLKGPYDEHDLPFVVEEVISVCRGLLANERFMSPKAWPFNIFAYKDCWIFMQKDEGMAISRNSLGVKVPDLTAMEALLKADKHERIVNIPYFADGVQLLQATFPI